MTLSIISKWKVKTIVLINCIIFVYCIHLSLRQVPLLKNRWISNDHISAYTTPTHFVLGTMENTGNIVHRTRNKVRRCCVGGDMGIWNSAICEKWYLAGTTCPFLCHNSLLVIKIHNAKMQFTTQYFYENSLLKIKNY